MMNEKDKASRDADIQAWFEKGLSQADIAEKLGITRQRVQQIERELGMSRERVYEKNEYKLTCGQCKKKFTTNKKDRKFCSRECFLKSRVKKLTKEEKHQRDLIRKEKNRIKAKEYYHNVFKKKDDWKEIVQERNKKQYAAQSTS